MLLLCLKRVHTGAKQVSYTISLPQKFRLKESDVWRYIYTDNILKNHSCQVYVSKLHIAASKKAALNFGWKKPLKMATGRN